jgi:PAS domain S-box-containing protein
VEIIELKHKSKYALEVANLIDKEWGQLSIHSYWHHLNTKKEWYSNFPRTLIAVSNGKLIGTVSILLNDLEQRIDLNPWIGCLYVKNEFRKQGVASKLLNEAEYLAANSLKIDSIYLFTENKELMYSKLGYNTLQQTEYRDRGETKSITIMQKPLSPEKYNTTFNDQILSQFFEKSHLSMWACDEQFKIVLWNKGAEFIYGYTKEEVLGKSYLDIFIDQAEREESIKDCKLVLQGYSQSNCCAFDSTRNNKKIYMLTNVFRITNPFESCKYLQAEIGIEISDLNLKKEEHRSLREINIASLSSSGIKAQIQHYSLILEKLEIQIKLNTFNLKSDLNNLNNSSTKVPKAVNDELIIKMKEFTETIEKAKKHNRKLNKLKSVIELNAFKEELDSFIKENIEL